MSIIKTKSRGINLADNFAFTGTVSGAGIEEIDQWELSGHFDDGYTAVAIINTWQRASAATSAKLGTGMTMAANGNFSFPKTGLYKITLDTIYYSISASDKAMGLKIWATANNFTAESPIGTAYTSLNYIAGSPTNQYVNASVNCLFNCTNISTHQVRIKTDSVDTAGQPSSIDVYGVQTDIHTGVLFERIGNAQ